MPCKRHSCRGKTNTWEQRYAAFALRHVVRVQSNQLHALTSFGSCPLATSTLFAVSVLRWCSSSRTPLPKACSSSRQFVSFSPVVISVVLFLTESAKDEATPHMLNAGCSLLPPVSLALQESIHHDRPANSIPALCILVLPLVLHFFACCPTL